VDGGLLSHVIFGAIFWFSVMLVPAGKNERMKIEPSSSVGKNSVPIFCAKSHHDKNNRKG